MVNAVGISKREYFIPYQEKVEKVSENNKFKKFPFIIEGEFFKCAHHDLLI